MLPETFWSMSPLEFWWMVDARRPSKKYGTLTEAEVEEIYEVVERGAFL
jgi:hypothetical protein